MKILDRIKAAYQALRGCDDGPVNDGHRFEISIGEKGFYADAYLIDRYGHPVWYYQGHGYRMIGTKFEGFCIKDFEPACSFEEFNKMNGTCEK